MSGPKTVSREESSRARLMTLSMGYQNRAPLDTLVRLGAPVRGRNDKRKGGRKNRQTMPVTLRRPLLRQAVSIVVHMFI